MTVTKHRILSPFFILAASFLFSCNGSTTEPDDTTLTSGSTIISTQEGRIGFSFSAGEVLRPPYDPDNYPDFDVQTNTTAMGTILGAFFVATKQDQSLRDAFALVHTANSEEEAKQFFDALSVVSTEDFKPLAITLAKNQVWVAKTMGQHFAKMLVLNNKVVAASYAEVKFEWVFQTNGSRNF